MLHLLKSTEETHRIDVFEHETVVLREEVAHLRVEHQRLSEEVQRHKERILSADFVMTNSVSKKIHGTPLHSIPTLTTTRCVLKCMLVV